MIRVEYKVSDAGFAVGVRHHMKRKGPWIGRIHLMFAPVFIIGGVLLFIYGDSLDYSRVIWLLVWGVLFIISYLAERWVSSRQMRRYPYLNEMVTCELSEEGISLTGKGFSLTQSWDRIFDVVILPDGLLIYWDKDRFSLVPKGSFRSEAELEEAVELVGNHLSKSK